MTKSVYCPSTGREAVHLEDRPDGLSLYEDTTTRDRIICRREDMDAYPSLSPHEIAILKRREQYEKTINKWNQNLSKSPLVRLCENGELLQNFLPKIK